MNVLNRILCCKRCFVHRAYTKRDNGRAYGCGNLWAAIHAHGGVAVNKGHQRNALAFQGSNNLSDCDAWQRLLEIKRVIVLDFQKRGIISKFDCWNRSNYSKITRI